MLCTVVLAAAVGAGSALANSPTPTTKTFTAGGCSVWPVPPGVVSVTANVVGAAGMQGGGNGDGESGTFAVGPNESLDVCVDTGGGTGGGSGAGRGGGGSSVALAGQAELGGQSSYPLIVAGGGGGGGGGGSPGGAAGSNGSDGSGVVGSGGGAGASPGGTGGAGVDGGAKGSDGGQYGLDGPADGGSGGSGTNDGGGGGGGGYYGGGGGGGVSGAGTAAGGGGGGSDYCDATLVSGCSRAAGAGTGTGAGSAAGDAQVTLTYYAGDTSVPPFTSTGCSAWTVPSGVSEIEAYAVGAAGSPSPVFSAGGAGDGVAATIAVQEGETFEICVNQGGGSSGANDGGGASGIAIGSDFSHPLVVAGGGGGAGDGFFLGGANGGAAGNPGGNSTGGTGTGGGAGAPGGGAAGKGYNGGGDGQPGGVYSAKGPGAGGAGGSGASTYAGGAGGGGYYGGGGGGGSSASIGDFAAGGGGGSDYCDPSALSCATEPGVGVGTSAGAASGDAEVVLTELSGQAISFTSSPPGSATVGGSYAVSATGGPSGSPVTFTIDPSSSAGACSISGSSVSFTGTGTCQVDANQAGGNGYAAAAQVSQSFSIAAKPSSGGSGGSSGSSGSSGSGGGAPSPLSAPFASILKALVNSHRHQAKLTFNASGSLTGYQCALVRVKPAKHNKHNKQKKHKKHKKHGKKPKHATLPFKSCSSPQVYKHLKRGNYVFYVRAVGPGGTQAPPVSRRIHIS
jgi:hypothetical protein